MAAKTASFTMVGLVELHLTLVDLVQAKSCLSDPDWTAESACLDDCHNAGCDGQSAKSVLAKTDTREKRITGQQP